MLDFDLHSGDGERPHARKSAFDNTSFTKSPTPGSFDARKPATFTNLIVLDSMNSRSASA